jgi:methylase of polypeptide subunit release factors
MLDKGSSLAKALIPSGPKSNLQILELGSGCGVVGLSLAQTIPDAQVLLTDLPEAEEIVERNIAQTQLAHGATVAFRELDWDAELPGDLRASSQKLDLVLAADCTYNPDSRYAISLLSVCFGF